MLRSDDDATNLPQVRGTGEEHFRYFVENRLNYCDSKWYAGEYPNDYAVVRIYTPVDENNIPLTNLAVPASANITVTPYSHMYAGVRYKANGTLYQERLEANETYTFEAPNEVFNDTETAIYGASQLSSLGDLAPLYLGYIDVGNATKLVELKVGDGTPGYQNGNLYHLAVGTNRLLKKIDIQNCIGFNQALVLSGCPNIEEVYAKGSGITGVDLPASGYLKKLQLPATIANLTLKNQPYVTDFSLEGYTNLKTVQIENCPTINSLDLLDKAINVERVRLTNVDWHYADASVLYELIDRDISGIDENGTNIDTMWIDGKCHIDTLTGNEYAEIKRLYPYLEITYNNLTSQLVFMTDDGETELYRQTIINGANGIDPVESGAIETPTKESTAQYHFEYMGWSLTPGGNVDKNALLKVEMDRYVYVAYYKDLRSYDVNFYNDTVLLQTQNVKYGTDATYVGSTPQKIPANEWETPSDFEFIGWNPEPTNIQGNTNCYAQYRDKREISHTWNQIIDNAKKGIAQSQYKIGSFKPIVLAKTRLPFNFTDGAAVVYNDEIHILGGTADNYAHYKCVGDKWVEVSTLPYPFYYGDAVVYNNEIHLLGGRQNYNKHYKWNGFEWIKDVDISRNFYNGGRACVYNNEIHIFGGQNTYYSHTKYDGSTWSEVGELPYSFQEGNILIYKDEIHSIGSINSKAHYKWNGTEWTQLENLPYPCWNTYAIVYNDKIHLLGGQNNNTRHWTFDGATWENPGSMPYPFQLGRSVIYNNEIHILGAKEVDYVRNHYYYNGAEWSVYGEHEIINMEVVAHNHDEISSTTRWIGGSQFNKFLGCGQAVVYNDKIHHFTQNKHRTFDADGTIIELNSLPFTTGNTGGLAAVWNDEIHIINGPSIHYKYNGSEWIQVCEQPFVSEQSTVGSCMTVYNNELYYVGGILSGRNNRAFYKFNGTEWVSLNDTPMDVYQSKMIEYNNKLHLFTGASHYTYDGSEWTKIGTLPHNFSNGSCVIYYNEIHFFGGSGNNTAHYKYDGYEWEYVDELPTTHDGVNTAVSVVYNNQIYLVSHDNSGANNITWKWEVAKWNVLTPHTGIPPQNVIIYNDEIWTQTRGTLTNFGDGSTKTSYSYINKPLTYATECFVFQNEIHMIGSEAAQTNPIHYKYDFTNNDWVIASNIAEVTAYGPHYANCCVYKDTLYYFNLYNKYYYTFNGTSWSEQYELPVSPESNTNLIVYNDKIHIFLGRNFNQHYTFDRSNWKFVCETPFSMKSMPLVVINNKLYALYYSDGFITYYEFNGAEWFNTKYKILSPYKTMTNSNTVVYQNKIYVVGVNNTDPSYEHYNRLNIARLENPKAGLTFLAKNLLKDRKQFCSVGGYQHWSTSDLRTWCNNDIFNLLPENLKTSIKEVIKVSDTGYDGQSLEEAHDKIWICSLEEIGDETGTIISGQGNTYPVFTDNDSRKRTLLNGSVGDYWTRTTHANVGTIYIIYGNSGISSTAVANAKYINILIGFCI